MFINELMQRERERDREREEEEETGQEVTGGGEVERERQGRAY